MTERLNRVALVALLCFGLVALSLTYWGVIASDEMLARGDNPRRVEAERAIQRGAIYDRTGQVLARSVAVGTQASGKPLMHRQYLRPETAAAVGYYSLTYGVGGAEAAFDRILRGDDLQTEADRAIGALLHRLQAGSDIRLTIDSDLHQVVLNALGARHGAVVIVEVPSGAVRAMISAPSFDPNQLDQNWETLRRDLAAPLLNRVTQGVYQPGGALQTVILAAMLTEGKVAEPLSNSTMPVEVNGLRLTCAVPYPGAVTTLQRAYALACPFVFSDAVINQPGPTKTQAMIAAFGLLQPPSLPEFETLSGRRAPSLPEMPDRERLRAASVGQGDLTVTPLHMALVAAVIANGGNTVTPHLADAVRLQGSSVWQPLPVTQTESAVTTQEVADTIRAAMREAVTAGAARAAGAADFPPGTTLYGHASIAYTGPLCNGNAWFIGFVALPDGRSLVAAVVIEGSVEAADAARIGGTALARAAQQ